MRIFLQSGFRAVTIIDARGYKTIMSFEVINGYLKECGYEDRVMQFEVSSATVELAAAAVGCEPARIAKTISFLTKEGAVLIVAAGDVKVDNSKFKAQFAQKAKMIPYEQVEELTGFKPGGVCPFCAKDGVRVYLDESLKRFDIIYPAAGSSNSAVRLTVDELLTLSNALGWVDVTKSAL